MDFNEFKYRITNLAKLELPGEEAQHKLAPVLRIQEMETVDFTNINPNKAGVLAVFYPDAQNQTHFVLILRKTYRGVHSNQVGFPGGRVEDLDRDLRHTALRETEEEVGISQTDVVVVKELTPLYIPPSNFWVYPFIGYVEKTPLLIPQESEVELVLEINLDEFLDDKNLINQILTTSYADEIEVLSVFIEWPCGLGCNCYDVERNKRIA
ncbi:CoA pyrophosphatase [Antarcticibacterium sp. 1MA-6-2]|uniref:NUDIX hydrolase n=1 Tax=Antarcticibacterium sp. 1MA-6-2 TaxID=2908210 RepID=UPI00288333CE|nr:CoA pyrophosphatase [Antarcticibacterium sp. 1MA-6-2]